MRAASSAATVVRYCILLAAVLPAASRPVRKSLPLRVVDATNMSDLAFQLDCVLAVPFGTPSGPAIQYPQGCVTRKKCLKSAFCPAGARRTDADQ
jgi:hypothetical protein